MFTRIILFIIMLSPSAWADLVIFHNGDRLYGNVINPDATQEIVMDVRGVEHVFKRSQVRNIHPDIQQPAPGEILRVSDFVESNNGTILSITASDITSRKGLKTKDRELIVDIENGFDISSLYLYPSNYAFFRREGAYLTAFIQNLGDKIWMGASFRAFFYQENGKLLGTKDFYVFRLPPVNENGRGGRMIELDLPDVPMSLIHRVRFVRKF